MSYQQSFYINSPSRHKLIIKDNHKKSTIQFKQPLSYPPNISQSYRSIQYQQPTLSYKQQPQQSQRIQQQQISISYSSIQNEQEVPIQEPNASHPTQIYNSSQQPQYRESVQQKVLPRNIQYSYQQTQQPPQQPQQQPQNLQQLIQQSIQTKPIQPPNQLKSQQMMAQQRSLEQIQYIPQSILQKDKDLEQKFQDAIDKTRDLVQRYQNSYQPQMKYLDNDEQQLQELALQYEDLYIYRGQGYEPQTREGYGILTDQNDNEVYSGYWHDNLYSGKGKLQNTEVLYIHGPFNYYDFNDLGNGWKYYEGMFLKGKMHGFGILQLANGERFEGAFKYGTMNGEGVYSTIYEGTRKGIWKNGRKTYNI